MTRGKKKKRPTTTSRKKTATKWEEGIKNKLKRKKK